MNEKQLIDGFHPGAAVYATNRYCASRRGADPCFLGITIPNASHGANPFGKTGGKVCLLGGVPLQVIQRPVAGAHRPRKPEKLPLALPDAALAVQFHRNSVSIFVDLFGARAQIWQHRRSEEHTSELQSLMRISYAVFCLKKQN